MAKKAQLEAPTEVALSEIGTERRKAFTLVELICVLAIAMILLALVVGRVGKTPLFLSLNETSLNVQNLMSVASSQAELNEKVVTLTYRDGVFQPVDVDVFASSDYKRHLQLALPKNIEIEFNYPIGKFEFSPKFAFYPDGTASGPDITLKLKSQMVVIHISKLTGQPVVTSK